MSSRAIHSKNRHGCSTCKRRKKKCDLAKPECRSCQRLGLDCYFPGTLVPQPDPANNADPFYIGLSSLPQADSTLYRALKLRPHHIDSGDFELATYFMRTQPSQFTTIPGLWAISKLDLAARSPRYPYLLHAILAASALHITYVTTQSPTGQSNFCIAKARFHNRAALSAYIWSLNRIDASSCHFVFGFSLVVACFQFAFCSLQTMNHAVKSNRHELLNDVIAIFDLMRGTVAIADAAAQWIPNCPPDRVLLPMRTMLHDRDTSVPSEIDWMIQGLVENLEHIWTQHSRGPAETLVCLSALADLRNTFTHLAKGDQVALKAILAWLAFVDNSYVDLVKDRHPMALVVLAHFAIALHRLNHLWWLRGVGHMLVHTIKDMLLDTGETCCFTMLEWPLAVVAQSRVPSLVAPTVPVHYKPRQLSRRQTTTLFDAAFDFTYTKGFSDP